MKYFQFICIIFLTSCMENSNNSSFTLMGHLEYPNQSIPIHQVNLDTIATNVVDSIKTDANGDFSLSIDVKESGIAFIRLPNGSPMDVFLEPNRKVQVFQKDGIIEYSDSARIYQFMKEMYQEYYKPGRVFIDEAEITEFYDSLLESQTSRLNSFKKVNSEELIVYMKYTMIGLNYSKRISYLSKIYTITKNSTWYNFLDEVIFTDENALLAKEYVNMQIRALPSIMERLGKDPSPDNAYLYLCEQIQCEKYRKYAQSMFLLFNYSNLSSSSREKILNDFRENYKGRIPVPVQGMLRLMPGQKMFDFELKKSNKNEFVKLSDFKDKMVLIDFWATWCKPCLKEEPFIYEIASLDSTEIIVLSINIDESEKKWLEHIKDLDELKNIKHSNLEGGLSSKIGRQFFLVGVPRYILLAKDNIIIDAFAPFPSSIEMRNLIQENK